MPLWLLPPGSCYSYYWLCCARVLGEIFRTQDGPEDRHDDDANDYVTNDVAVMWSD